MTKPCLPYTGQFLENIKRTKELYKDHGGFVSMGNVGNRVDMKPRKQRFDLGEK